MRLKSTTFWAVGLAFSIGCAQAGSIVYDNLGTGGNVYDSQVAWTISGNTAELGLSALAFSFTPGSSTHFSELDIALGYSSGTNSVIVDLMGDAAGAPGSLLETWTISGLPLLGGCCGLQTLQGDGTIPLTSGTSYWVAVLPGSGSTSAGWAWNTTGATGTVFADSGAGWTNQGSGVPGAFAVLGSETAVPEPGTAALVLSPLMIVLVRRNWA